MIRKYLKRDLRKRVGINLTLGLFMFLAALFLSVSLKNIVAVVNGVDYSLNKSKVPDLLIILSSATEKDEIDDYLKENSKVGKYDFFQISQIQPNKLKLINPNKKYVESNSNLFFSPSPSKSNVVFDENNQSFTVKPGKIAVPLLEANRNGFKRGDKIAFDFGDYKKEFEISCITKDGIFGSDMSGMVRYILNDDDYSEIMKNISKIPQYQLLSITTDDYKGLLKDIDGKQFKTIFINLPIDTIRMLYAMDIVLASTLILIGICFILITFFVLRFTLTFTMEENYREIGIMQAIGIKISKIRLIFIVKYVFLVLIGSVIGFILSIPLSNILLNYMSKTLIISDGNSYIWANITGTISVIVVVTLFSYKCTSKIKKMSVVDTIRGGASGERYHKRKGIQLHNKQRMSVPLFLGINDVLSSIKKYMALMITFSICFVLISIPLNTINTMTDDSIVTKFSLNPTCDVLISGFEGMKNDLVIDQKRLDKNINNLKEDLKSSGYKPDIIIPYLYNLRFEINDSTKNIMCLQIKKNPEFLEYCDGSAPVLENEIAMSKQALEENDLSIGDSVKIGVNGENKDFIITGSYTDYMQLGKSARLNPIIDLPNENIISVPIMVYLGKDMNMTKEQICNHLKNQLPDYNWSTVQDYLDDSFGTVKDIFNDSLIPMTVVIGIIISLIVIMMEQLFIVREKGEIAMLKSIGFKNRAIRRWQAGRMVLAALISMILAVPLSMLSNQFLLKPVFSIMGADVDIVVKPFDAYILYPGILFIVIIFSTLVATLRVRNIKIQDLNNLE